MYHRRIICISKTISNSLYYWFMLWTRTDNNTCILHITSFWKDPTRVGKHGYSFMNIILRTIHNIYTVMFNVGYHASWKKSARTLVEMNGMHGYIHAYQQHHADFVQLSVETHFDRYSFSWRLAVSHEFASKWVRSVSGGLTSKFLLFFI